MSATSIDELSIWFDRAKNEPGCTHMIVVCDTFSYEDYPVIIKSHEDVRERAKEYDGVKMQRIMEVYSMALDKDEQMAEHRAFHWD